MTSASDDREDFAQFAFLLTFTRQMHRALMVWEQALMTQLPRPLLEHIAHVQVPARSCQGPFRILARSRSGPVRKCEMCSAAGYKLTRELTLRLVWIARVE